MPNYRVELKLTDVTKQAGTPELQQTWPNEILLYLPAGSSNEIIEVCRILYPGYSVFSTSECNAELKVSQSAMRRLVKPVSGNAFFDEFMKRCAGYKLYN